MNKQTVGYQFPKFQIYLISKGRAYLFILTYLQMQRFVTWFQFKLIPLSLVIFIVRGATV